MKQRCSLLLLQGLEDGCCIFCTQIVADHEAKWRNLFQVGQLPNVCAAGVHQDGQLQPCSLMNKLRILGEESQLALWNEILHQQVGP
jgi:hypothetical protein